jgi:hypothetical protein
MIKTILNYEKYHVLTDPWFSHGILIFSANKLTAISFAKLEMITYDTFYKAVYAIPNIGYIKMCH